MEYITAEEILAHLQSIQKIEFDGIYAVVTMNGEQFVRTEFVKGSFRRELLELIEKHLNG